MTWRRLQLRPAAQLQRQAHRQAQQEGYEEDQEQQLQSNIFKSAPATPAQYPQTDDSLTERISRTQQQTHVTSTHHFDFTKVHTLAGRACQL